MTGNNRRQPACLVLLKAPDCQKADFSRQNHLGNGENLEPLRYTWKLPYFPSGKTQRIVVRMRYESQCNVFALSSPCNYLMKTTMMFLDTTFLLMITTHTIQTSHQTGEAHSLRIFL